MDTDETVDLIEEIVALRRHVAELSETVADYRARGLHQASVIARLQRQLRSQPQQEEQRPDSAPTQSPA